MNLIQLCSLIKLPNEVILEVQKYFNDHNSLIEEPLRKRLLSRLSWEIAMNELKQQIGDDKFGFNILAEMLNLACNTYEIYRKQGIGQNVFVRTMEFCTRFINRHKQIYGYYAFTWDWWFIRQIAMQEFRVEELEFEFLDLGQRQINIHIPSDADIRPQKLQTTFHAFQNFLIRYYPEWSNIDWFCESWMLSPSLENLLDEKSNILYFKRLFEIESFDMESMAVLDWVFPASTAELKNLAETTSLQRKMKEFLLNGGKVGWAKGKYKIKKRFIQ